MVTEVGRQPWIVQGYMRTSEAVTEAPGVSNVLVGTLAVYFVIGVATVSILYGLAQVPIRENERGTG